MLPINERCYALGDRVLFLGLIYTGRELTSNSYAGSTGFTSVVSEQNESGYQLQLVEGIVSVLVNTWDSDNRIDMRNTATGTKLRSMHVQHTALPDELVNQQSDYYLNYYDPQWEASCRTDIVAANIAAASMFIQNRYPSVSADLRNDLASLVLPLVVGVKGYTDIVRDVLLAAGNTEIAGRLPSLPIREQLIARCAEVGIGFKPYSSASPFLAASPQLPDNMASRIASAATSLTHERDGDEEDDDGPSPMFGEDPF